MSALIYKRYGFHIIRAHNGYIVHNTRKPWVEGHTHLYSYKSAIDAIYFVANCEVPQKGGLYYLTSLQRLTRNCQYTQLLEERKDEIKKQYPQGGGEYKA